MSDIINTDLGQNVPWIAYKNGHNAISMPFTSSGVYDISALTFTLNIKNPNTGATVLSLTQGSGLTNGGVTGILSVVLTKAQASTTLTGYDYFYELLYDLGGLTYRLIQGALTLTDKLNPGDTTTTSIPVEVSIASSTVNIDVNIVQSTSPILASTFSLSSADILALNNTPILAFAAPGANKYYSFNQENFNYIYGGTPYTRNSSAGIILSYDQVTAAPLLAVGNILTLSSDSTREVFTTGLSDVSSSLYVNKPVYIMLNGGSFTLGNGTLKIKVLYQIIDLN